MLYCWVVAILLVGCEAAPATSGEPTINFYHWTTELDPDTTARQLLDSFQSDRLYVKAFDVDAQAGRLVYSARVKMRDTIGLPSLVPVIFITNAALRQTSSAQILPLARQLCAEAEQLFGTGFTEWQIDCDWTAGTQVRYFALLRAVQNLRPRKTLSCTVRLHQYRDRKTQGVPPVPRATLMAYNVGDLNAWETPNAIYDPAVVKVYLAGQPPYPVPLDLAVAVFDWAAVYRREQLAYLINEPDRKQLADTSRFLPLGINRYRVIRSTYLEGVYLYAGDKIRCEGVFPEQLGAQAVLQKYYVKSFAGQQIQVFRLGSRGWRRSREDKKSPRQ